jgi:TonB family protein
MNFSTMKIFRLLALVCVTGWSEPRVFADTQPFDFKMVEVVGTLRSFILNKVEPTGFSEWDLLVYTIDSPERLKGKPFSILADYYPRPRSAERRQAAHQYWTQKIGMRTKLTVTERVLFTTETAPCVLGCPNWQVRFTEPTEPPEPSAVFPAELRAAGKQGMAIVHFTVTSDGSVENAIVPKEDHPLFGAAALEAVKRWKFPQPMPGDVMARNGVAAAIYFIIEDEPAGPSPTR